MRRWALRIGFVAALALAGAGFIHASGVAPKYLGICSMSDLTQSTDPEVERYFYPGGTAFDTDLACAAKAIAEGRALTAGELTALEGKVDMRAGDDITLLNFAALKQNLAVIDQLLAIGADPTLPLKTSGPDIYDSFISLISTGSGAIATEMMALYLKHGGDPDRRAGVNNTPLVSGAALMANVESFKILVDADADVWQPEGPVIYSPNGPIPEEQLDQTDVKLDGAAILRAAANAKRENDFSMLDYAIEKGAIDHVDNARIGRLLHWVTFYTMRDDEPSREIVRMTRLIMDRTGYAGDANTREALEFGRARGW